MITVYHANIFILVLIYLFGLFFTLRWLAEFKQNKKPTIVSTPRVIQKILDRQKEQENITELLKLS